MLIKENFDIKNYTTFKIGGNVRKVYFPQTQAEISELLRDLDDYIVLGSCSNVLFSTNGYEGNIIMTTELDKWEIRGNKVFASCGVKGPKLAQAAADEGLSGFEFMIGFPGSIGGDICMNAGAHGQRISDCLTSCCVFNRKSKEIEYKNKSEMGFSYRNSIIRSGGYVLLHAEFDLKKADEYEIKSLIDRNLEFRRNVQPSLKYPNAGSVFKNPENDSAGRLLEKAGAKNFDYPNVKVWDNHANFIINKGNAQSVDVLELMLDMYNAVKEQYTIELEPEILFVGNKSEKEEKIWNILYQKKQK